MAKQLPLTQGYFATVDDADFEWLSRWKWAYHHRGYAMRTERRNGKKTTIFMHRLILQPAPGVFIDHANGDGLDNRRSNLRLATNRENQYNQKPRKGRRSQFKGVSWVSERGKWKSQIVTNGKRTFLGYFDNDLDAAIAYDQAAIKLHGEYARINPPVLDVSYPRLKHVGLSLSPPRHFCLRCTGRSAH